jgi:hypothetical protein
MIEIIFSLVNSVVTKYPQIDLEVLKALKEILAETDNNRFVGRASVVSLQQRTKCRS